jgi:hypothetical protein
MTTQDSGYTMLGDNCCKMAVTRFQKERSSFVFKDDFRGVNKKLEEY